MPVARWRTDLRKKCVRCVARDDGDERAGTRPRRYYDDGRTDADGRGRRNGCDGQAVASVAVRHLQKRDCVALAKFAVRYFEDARYQVGKRHHLLFGWVNCLSVYRAESSIKYRDRRLSR